MKWIAKRWLLAKLNKLLESIKDGEKMEYWTAKVAKILQFLVSVSKAIEDRNITDEEADALIAEAETLFE